MNRFLFLWRWLPLTFYRFHVEMEGKNRILAYVGALWVALFFPIIYCLMMREDVRRGSVRACQRVRAGELPFDPNMI